VFPTQELAIDQVDHSFDGRFNSGSPSRLIIKVRATMLLEHETIDG
jgi:hypothetical protein